MGTPDKAIPNSVLAKAEGIAVFPPTVKGGFIFGAHRGQTRGQILVTSVLEGDGALWRLCPGDPRLRRPHVGSVMIGYIKAVIFFEGLTATSGRNLAPIRPHSPPHRLATITDGVAGWLPGPTAASRRPARRRAVSRRSVEAPHELPQHHLHVDGRDRGHHQDIHGGAREALHEAMVERIARGEVGGEALHHQATQSCTVERGGKCRRRRGRRCSAAAPGVRPVPVAAAGAGRDWAGSSTTTRGRRAGGFSRTRWLDPRLGRETVDPPGHVEIMGAGGPEPRPRAPAASRPSHERPGGRVPRPCRLATWQEGRVARIVDDTGLIAIGVDRSVWLDARGEDGPGQRVGPVQRAGGHVPVLRPVEPFRQILPVAGFGQRAARPPPARAGVGAARRGRGRRARSCRAARWGGRTGRIRAPYMCTRPPRVAPHTSPSRRLRTFPFPVRPIRANVDGRRLLAATTTEGPSP